MSSRLQIGTSGKVKKPRVKRVHVSEEMKQKVKELESLIRGGHNLFDFHMNNVAPTEEEKIKKKQSIKDFANFLKETADIPGFTVNKVLKSGSLGKGTAVKGSADVDLVVFYNGFQRMRPFRSRRVGILKLLRQKVEQYPDWEGRIQIVRNKTSPFSLKYIFDGEELDVLPAMDVVNVLTKETVYGSISMLPKKNKRAQLYSASLAPLQKDFVKYQDETVKRAIRILKFWKKGKGKPVADIPSYSVELLTIKAWQTTPEASTESLVTETLKMLAHPHALRVVLDTENYTFANYSGSSDWPPEPPYIIDPANPYMNVLSRVKPACWTKVGRAAQAALPPDNA